MQAKQPWHRKESCLLRQRNPDGAVDATYVCQREDQVFEKTTPMVVSGRCQSDELRRNLASGGVGHFVKAMKR